MPRSSPRARSGRSPRSAADPGGGSRFGDCCGRSPGPPARLAPRPTVARPDLADVHPDDRRAVVDSGGRRGLPCRRATAATDPPAPPRRARRPRRGRALLQGPASVTWASPAAIASELIREQHLRTALELGPHLRPLIRGADVMDIVHNAAPPARGAGGSSPTRSKAPWPVDDKTYDLFVALQVFEHLGTHQPEAFREVRRVARNAILSLPIDWVMADPRNCHHGLTNERVLDWFAPVVPTRVVVGTAAIGSACCTSSRTCRHRPSTGGPPEPRRPPPTRSSHGRQLALERRRRLAAPRSAARRSGRPAPRRGSAPPRRAGSGPGRRRGRARRGSR